MNPAACFETITSQIILSFVTDSVVAPQAHYLFAARAWTGIGLLTEWLQNSCDLPIDEFTLALKGFFCKAVAAPPLFHGKKA